MSLQAPESHRPEEQPLQQTLDTPDGKKMNVAPLFVTDNPAQMSEAIARNATLRQEQADQMKRFVVLRSQE